MNTHTANGLTTMHVTTSTKQRLSNLELLRILAMLFIVAHHSVVNSGIAEQFDIFHITPNTIFLQLWGMWGKTAINVFVLITGYFMCTSKLTWQRVAKIYLEAKFYKVIFFVVFLVAGYEKISLKSIFDLCFGYLRTINAGFVGSFLVLYLLIPFMNAWIEKLGRDLWKLVGLFLTIFTVTSTFFFNSNVFHYVFWYMTLYLTAAWFRLYPSKWTNDKKITGILFAVSVILAYCSVLAINFLVDFLHMDRSWMFSYYFVSDSNKFFAFLVGTSAFLFFKNITIKQSKIINLVSSTTFGVLCIHANSDAMRQWLWRDLLHVPQMYHWNFVILIIANIAMTVGIFAVCSLIDMLRIWFVEKPVFIWLNQHALKIEHTIKAILSPLQKYKQRIIES